MEHPTYDKNYVEFMQDNGNYRKTVIIDEKCKLAFLSGAQKNCTERLIFISTSFSYSNSQWKYPEVRGISIKGKYEFPNHKDEIYDAYPFELQLIDENGNEISDDAIIRIVKGGEDIITIDRIRYGEIKFGNETKYKFKYVFECLYGDTLEIYIVKTGVNVERIPEEGIKFRLKADVWFNNPEKARKKTIKDLQEQITKYQEEIIICENEIRKIEKEAI